MAAGSTRLQDVHLEASAKLRPERLDGSRVVSFGAGRLAAGALRGSMSHDARGLRPAYRHSPREGGHWDLVWKAG